MAERNVGRPWTEVEDQLLKEAVAKHGEHDNWKNIALCIPGRTNKACRKRWLHSLSPNVKKTAWTQDEDKLLLDLYEQYGAKWSTIARSIPGRTDDACSKRYREALDPSLKKDEWTSEEDEKLLEVFGRIGGKWGQIGQEMQRSGLGCRNRWRLLERKKAAALRAEEASIQDSQSTVSAESQPDPGFNIWPPYYPPESYPIPGSSLSPSHSFRLPSPDIVPVSPHVAPFQYSSSSLSAALSAPPQLPRPLPPVSSEPPLMDVQPQPEPPSLADTTLNADQNDEHDDLMSLDDPLVSLSNETAPAIEHLTTSLLPPVFASPLLQPPISLNVQQSISISPISQSNDNPFHFDPLQEFWKSPNLSDLLAPLFEQSPQSTPNTLLADTNYEDSSAASTPFSIAPSVSPISSPNVSSPVDLPGSEQSMSSTTSLLFSTPREPTRPHVPPSRSRRPTSTSKKLLKPGTPMRLSSNLPLTANPSIRPYACGTDTCWPSGATTSRSCFTTSKELFDHNKIEHSDEPYTEKPFRCALAGCGKSWKSINGLQYHLQMYHRSTAHFRTALSTRFSSQSLNEENGSGTDPEGEDNERDFVCPVPDCFKAYKHSSGLRYHMKHVTDQVSYQGHPQNLPAQLSEVPPALARQIPTKTRRMRRKAHSEEL
ncbi:Transcriptional activator Myb [Leucoagaricus sp. SymC.cos]|nr:Transcriptional activator Myb [Leucoagaricus sp. SymC.cos]